MWPKSRPPPTAYQPLHDTEQQHDQAGQPQAPSLWPTAPISSSKLLSGNNAIKRSQLLGGDAKINNTLLLGGNQPIATHLLLRPNLTEREAEPKELDVAEDDNDDFEHLDYLEPTDDMPLTSRTRLRRRLPQMSFRNAALAAAAVVLVASLGTFIAVFNGPERPLGRADYKG